MSAPSPSSSSAAPLSVRVNDLHIDYEVFEERRAALRQRFVNRSGSGRSVIHAVRGVSFDVHEGEAVGVLGSNGSGKSTLLLSIAGLLTPASGDILVNAEPRLMGVGATLIPTASGLRNIRLGCLALGLDDDTITERLPQIVEFIDIGDAIERPLRTYSSGMRARLHFAIATAVIPRILLIDEALSVGDKRFREKSARRIDEMLEEAGTLLLVSHSLPELAARCTRGIWLEKGTIRADGPIDAVIEQYEASN